jgi:hypothetical protein
MVQRQHAPHLRLHNGWIRLADERCIDDALGILGDDRGGVMPVIVGDEGE